MRPVNTLPWRRVSTSWQTSVARPGGEVEAITVLRLACGHQRRGRSTQTRARCKRCA